MKPPILNHEYYYGNESEQYTFYRLPKILFTDSRYKDLSDGAKILYGLMLDRMGLSVRNNWMDKNNRVYIYFTLEDIQEYMNCGHNKGVKLLSELDNIGLIERIKYGQGKPTKVFVKKFLTNDNNHCRENTNEYDYYYGNESEQYTFYRLPKVLFTDDSYKNLSDGGKILYGLMLDRMGLSVRNNWMDEHSRVYIFFTLEDIQENMNCGHNKGVKIMSELDNIGLIERVKQGQGKPTKVFVKRFFSNGNTYSKRTDGFSDGNKGIYEAEAKTSDNRNSRLPISGNQDLSKPEIKTSDNENPRLPINGIANFLKTEIQTSDNGKCRLPICGSADFPIADTNNTNIINTEFRETDFKETELNETGFNNINPIKSYLNMESKPVAQNRFDKMDRIREINEYRELIKYNIEYDALCQDYGEDRIDEIVELLTDTVCSTREYIRVSKEDVPSAVVKSRLLKINMFHIQYFIDCFDKTTTKVYNIHQYLLTSIYKAPTSMDSYYKNAVNHDMYSNKE